MHSLPADGGNVCHRFATPGRHSKLFLLPQQEPPDFIPQGFVQGQHPAVEDESDEDEEALGGVEDGEEDAQHVQRVAYGVGRLLRHRADDGRGQAEDPGEAHHAGHLDVQDDVVTSAQLARGIGGAGSPGPAVAGQAVGLPDAGDGPGEEDAVHEEDEQDGRSEGEHGGQGLLDPAAEGAAPDRRPGTPAARVGGIRQQGLVVSDPARGVVVSQHAFCRRRSRSHHHHRHRRGGGGRRRPLHRPVLKVGDVVVVGPGPTVADADAREDVAEVDEEADSGHQQRGAPGVQSVAREELVLVADAREDTGGAGEGPVDVVAHDVHPAVGGQETVVETDRHCRAQPGDL